MSKANKPTILAIIPARGGSKRLPRKNAAPINKKPLVSYTIEAALGSNLIDRVVLSTEDERIQRIGLDHKIEVMIRPEKLAQDTVGNNEVIEYVIKQYEKQNKKYDIVMLLQPTSPLRTAKHVDECINLFLAGEWRSAMSVTLAEHHPAKLVHIKDGVTMPYEDEVGMEAQSQALKKVYRQNGAIYLTFVKDFLKSSALYQAPCMPYIMEQMTSVDIDTELDKHLAEVILSKTETLHV